MATTSTGAAPMAQSYAPIARREAAEKAGQAGKVVGEQPVSPPESPMRILQDGHLTNSTEIGKGPQVTSLSLEDEADEKFPGTSVGLLCLNGSQPVAALCVI